MCVCAAVRNDECTENPNEKIAVCVKGRGRGGLVLIVPCDTHDHEWPVTTTPIHHFHHDTMHALWPQPQHHHPPPLSHGWTWATSSPRIASPLASRPQHHSTPAASSLGFSPPTSALNACMVGGGSMLGLHCRCAAERSPSASYTVRLASNSTGTLFNHSSPSLPSAARTFLPNILLPPPQLTPPLPNHGSCIGCALLQIRQVPSRAPIHRNF